MTLKMGTYISAEVVIVHCAGRLVFGDETAAFRERIKNIQLGTNHGALASTRIQGGEIKLVGPTRRVVDLLRRTRLDTVFKTYESDEEAVAAFSTQVSKPILKQA